MKKVFFLLQEYSYSIIYPILALISLFYIPKVKHNPHAKKGTIVIVFCWFTPNIIHYKWVSYLERKGFRTYLINLPLLFEDFPTTAKRLDRSLAHYKLKDYTLVGISTGALVCLYYLHAYKKWNQIHKFISIGGPLHGTPRARLLSFVKKGRDMRPDSKFIKELMRIRIPTNKMVTLSIVYDELVPRDYSKVENGISYVLPIWGHNRFHLNSEKTYDLIAHLAESKK